MATGLSLNGWVYPSPRLVTVKVAGANRRLTLDADAVILAAVAADYHRTVAQIDVGAVDDAGYCDRDGRLTPGRKSNHANGTACDLNWSQEGAGWSQTARTFWQRAKARAAIAVIKLRYGSCVTWGGDWNSGRPGGAWDPMHFEIRAGASRVKVRALAKKLHIDSNGVRH